MASSLLPFLCTIFAATTFAQNGSPEDGGGAPAATYTSPAHPGPSQVDNAAGASGGAGGYSLSTGGEVAIIVVVVVVALLGIGSAVLFYVAKKRQWEVRKTIKRASRRVVSKVDPRQSRQSRPKGMVRMQDPPPSAKPADLEKGNVTKSGTNDKSKRQAMQVDDSKTNQTPEKKFKTVLPESWTIGGKK